MNRTVRQMTLDDALYVIRNMRASDRAALRALQPTMTDEQFAIDRLQTTYHCVLSAGPTPVAIGGVNVQPSGTAVAWLIATDEINKVGKSLVRFCNQFARELFEHGGVHRIEGYVLAGVPDCERFARFFGLQFEGTRRKAGANGEDISIYGRV